MSGNDASTDPRIEAELRRIESELGERVMVSAHVVEQALAAESAAAVEVTDTFYGGGPRLMDTLESRIYDLLARHLGYVGEDEGAYSAAARLFAFETFHDPTHRPDTAVPRFDMSGWPFTFIDWRAAGDALEREGRFGRDLFIIEGHLFQRSLTAGEEMALDDDWVRD